MSGASLWRLRYKLSLRDLAAMLLIRGFVFSYEAVRDWEAKLTPALAEDLRRRRDLYPGARPLEVSVPCDRSRRRPG
jgi:putative transposase